jgi:hypothetical protein
MMCLLTNRSAAGSAARAEFKINVQNACPPTASTLPLIGGTTAGPAGSSPTKLQRFPTCWKGSRDFSIADEARQRGGQRLRAIRRGHGLADCGRGLGRHPPRSGRTHQAFPQRRRDSLAEDERTDERHDKAELDHGFPTEGWLSPPPPSSWRADGGAGRSRNRTGCGGNGCPARGLSGRRGWVCRVRGTMRFRSPAFRPLSSHPASADGHS